MIVSSGYFSYGGDADATQREQIMCEVGYACKEGVRTQCVKGQYAKEPWQSFCRLADRGTHQQTPCPAGTYAAEPGGSACQKCGPGTVSIQASSFRTSCSPLVVVKLNLMAPVLVAPSVHKKL